MDYQLVANVDLEEDIYQQPDRPLSTKRAIPLIIVSVTTTLFFLLTIHYVTNRMVNDNNVEATTTTITTSANQTDEIMISYNLCRLIDDLTPRSRYPQQNDHDRINVPYFSFSPYPDLQPSYKGLFRLYIHETRFDYTQGMFVLLAGLYSDDFEQSNNKDDTRKYKTHLERLFTHLVCRDSISQTPVPISKHVIWGPQHVEFQCPYPLFPAMIPRRRTFTLELLLDDPDSITFLSDTNALKESSTQLSICAYERPVVDWSWCGKDLVGDDRMMHQLLTEFIVYHQVMGIEKFMIFDPDGFYLSTLLPYITRGWVDYYRTPRLYRSQGLDDRQDLEMDICRARYWYSTRFIAFWDIDEWIVMSQPHDPVFDKFKEEKTPTIAPPILSSSISMLNQATMAMQNHQDNRASYLVATAIPICQAIVRSDNNNNNKSLMTIPELYPTCDRNQGFPKYWHRPAQGNCFLSGHYPSCEGQHTSNFLRRDRVMLLHYFNVPRHRAEVEGKLFKLDVPQPREIITRAKLSQD